MQEVGDILHFRLSGEGAYPQQIVAAFDYFGRGFDALFLFRAFE